MAVKKITRPDFAAFVYNLTANVKVYGVQAKGDRFDFAPLLSAKGLRLDYDVTLQPPKKFFIPPIETLLTFEADAKYKSSYDDEKFVLLGVHPYDMVAINQLDELFRQGYFDKHYFTRRNNATIVAIDVVTPSQNVFAAEMGAAVVKEGFDVLLTDIGDAYVVEIATDKGQQLFSIAKMSDAGNEDIKKRQEVQENNKKLLAKHKLKCPSSYLPKLLEKAYNHPVWEEKAATCFSCGSCNHVCPTCYCFNVQDDVNWDMKTGKRSRAWDGCMLDGFAKVAGNHDLRKNRSDRFRHRLYRKAKYVPEKINCGMACVGCGRCVAACLPDIANPVAVYNRLVDDLGIG
jgi:sulfhydrogenase subunit beta (sulfur reductase)